MISSCMGGWCSRRDRCALYEAPGRPSERLCAKGQDGSALDPAAEERERIAKLLDAEHEKRKHLDNHAAFYARMIRESA
jgi:hypothetical protein